MVSSKIKTDLYVCSLLFVDNDRVNTFHSIQLEYFILFIILFFNDTIQDM